MATTSFRLPDMPYYLQTVPGSITPILYTAKSFRQYTSTYDSRTGILGPVHFRVVQTSVVGWSVEVKAGFANLPGGYTVRQTEDVTLSVPSAWNPNTGTVHHRVFVAVYDELVAGTESYGELQVVQDLGAGAPTPAGAASYLELATISVSSSQSNIQNANIANKVRHGGSAFDKADMTPYLAAGVGPAVGDGHVGPYLQYDAGLVRLSGRILRMPDNFSSGSASENKDIAIATLPTQYRPAATRSMIGSTSKNLSGGSSLYFCRIEVLADGKMSARIPTGQTVEYLTFDNMFYWIDSN